VPAVASFLARKDITPSPELRRARRREGHRVRRASVRRTGRMLMIGGSVVMCGDPMPGWDPTPGVFSSKMMEQSPP